MSTRVLFRVGKVANETGTNFSVSDHMKLFAMRHADWALHLMGTCVCVCSCSCLCFCSCVNVNQETAKICRLNITVHQDQKKTDTNN